MYLCTTYNTRLAYYPHRTLNVNLNFSIKYLHKLKMKKKEKKLNKEGVRRKIKEITIRRD